MSILNHHPLEKALNRALDHASPVPEMPVARLHAAAMAGFPYRKPLLENWAFRAGAVAATIVLGCGAYIALQSHQSLQKALVADSDAFAAQLLNESF